MHEPLQKPTMFCEAKYVVVLPLLTHCFCTVDDIETNADERNKKKHMVNYLMIDGMQRNEPMINSTE